MHTCFVSFNNFVNNINSKKQWVHLLSSIISFINDPSILCKTTASYNCPFQTKQSETGLLEHDVVTQTVIHLETGPWMRFHHNVCSFEGATMGWIIILG